MAHVLDGCPPAWQRTVEVRVICKVFAKAFGVDAPSLRSRSADEALAELHAFTAARMLAALASGEAPACRERLLKGARRLGTWARRALPLGQQGRQRLVRYLYRGIGIELTGAMPGTLRFGPCSFAQAYTPTCCELMSAFDEGFICGVLGLEGPLAFTCRLTEGHPCCLAHVR